MRLGVVVTDGQFAQQAIALLKGADARGWDLRCFLTDSGVQLLGHEAFRDFLKTNSEAHVSLCELSVDRYPGADPHAGGLAERVIIGGQYQDAELVKNSDQVIVL
ncbi:MAG: hypothetical protein ACLFQT_04950 [Thiohalophilus sp.]